MEGSIEELTGYGPAMLRLNEKQQRYVLAMLADPFGNPAAWARAAGYSDKSEGAKVRGHYLSHNQKISDAADEVAKQYLGTMGPIIGIATVMRIAKNSKHPKQLRAAEMILNRVGLHETTEHRVVVSHTDKTGAAMIERITALAKQMGLDPAELLGANAAPQMKLIEHAPAAAK